MAILNLNRLLNCSPSDVCPIRIRGYVCETCLCVFRLAQTLEKHKPICIQQRIQGTIYTLPEKKQLRFSTWNKSIAPKFCIYADFESVLEKPDHSDDDESLSSSSSSSNSEVLQIHKPIAAGFVLLKEEEEDQQQYEEFFGPDCVVQFLERVEQHAKSVKNWYDQNAHQPMERPVGEELTSYMSAVRCYLCKDEFTLENHKVCDHDHFTGKFLGAACNQCNLSRRIIKPTLPVVFHNLRGYDMHLIIKDAVGKFPHWELQTIAQSKEKFQALIVYIKDCACIKFIDSFQFLSTSLSTLASMLPNDEKILTRGALPSNIPADGKGIFPYSYATSQEVLEAPREQLPSREEAFFDTLANKIVISREEHQKASRIWDECGCHNLKDYMMIYLKMDVYLLADIFQAFRKTALKEDSLDPLNFFSIPGLSWSSALKSLPQPLDLLQDIKMYEFFEAGIRGGMTFVNQHHAVKSSTSHLLYIDINNLYGWALSQKLPYQSFEWIINDIELQNIISAPLPDENADEGYVFEVDLHVPQHQHDYLSDLPPAPIMQKPSNATAAPAAKLLLTLEDKKNYIVHSALLKFYVEVMGVVVTKVHRAVRFQQSAVFQKYIASNTTKRAAAKTKFHKDYYKLKNNSLYGKTVENLRKRKCIRLCNTEEKFLACTSKPTFKSSIILDESLVLAVMTKESICLDRPVYIGQAVLDLSKLRMYRLQYCELAKYRANLGVDIKILAGDTDSFFLQVSSSSSSLELLLKMMKEDGLLDTSNYPPTSALFSKQFENKIGLFKDESGGVDDYVEWVFLRPKCYSMRCSNDQVSSHKAKGVKKNTHLMHQQYIDVYNSFNPTEPTHTPSCVTVEQRNIVSRTHQLQTITYTKCALSVRDDKRVWVSKNVSLPYGHYKLL